MFGRGGVRAGAVDGGEEAGSVEGEGEVQVVLVGGDGGEAEAGFGCVLEVGAHVCDVEDGGHGGRLFLWFVLCINWIAFVVEISFSSEVVKVRIDAGIVRLRFFGGGGLTAHRLETLPNRPIRPTTAELPTAIRPATDALRTDFAKRGWKGGEGCCYLVDLSRLVSILVVLLEERLVKNLEVGD